MPDEEDPDFEFTDAPVANDDPYGETQVPSPRTLQLAAEELQMAFADTLVMSPGQDPIMWAFTFRAGSWSLSVCSFGLDVYISIHCSIPLYGAVEMCLFMLYMYI